MVRSVTCVILVSAALCAAQGSTLSADPSKPLGTCYPSVIARIYGESRSATMMENEILLRNDVLDFDSGYARSALRSDGKIVSIYYLKPRERIELHFEATLRDPDPVE